MAPMNMVYDVEPDAFRSNLARELLKLGPRLGARVQLHPAVIVIVELIVCICEAYLAEDDAPFDKRLELVGRQSLSVLDDAVDDSAIEAFEHWVQRLQRTDGKRFIERALGSAFRHRYEDALRQDMKTVVPAIRKGLVELLPMAYAYDTCVALLGGSQDDGPIFVTALVTADQALAAFGTHNYQMRGEPLRPAAAEVKTEVADLVSRVSKESEQQAVGVLERWGTPLIRKVRGARDVIGTSRDGVSQAAHSMVEFIDRLLRGAFSTEEVLSWLTEHLPDRLHELTYRDRDQIRPTKLGQALCFLHAGQPPNDSFAIYEQMAQALVTARRLLQRYKHADPVESNDIPAEVDLAIRAVESVLVVIMKFAWLLQDKEQTQQVVKRIQHAS